MAVLPDEHKNPLAAPPAPGVAAVRNTLGVAAQDTGSLTQKALEGQKDAEQTAARQYQPPGHSPTAQQQQQQAADPKPEARTTQQTQTAPQSTTSTTQSTPPPPNPYGQTKNDPRDANYWANKKALESSFYASVAGLDREQLDDDLETNQYGMELAEYNRRRKRNMGESRLGTGSAYSGSARRDQIENDIDFSNDLMRRERQKTARDFDRNQRRGQLRSQLDADLRELETATAKEMAEKWREESATSAGDADKQEERPGVSKAEKRKEQLRKQMASQTKRIKALRERLDKSENPKQQERIRKKIKRIRDKRTQNQGKLGKLTTGTPKADDKK